MAVKTFQWTRKSEALVQFSFEEKEQPYQARNNNPTGPDYVIMIVKCDWEECYMINEVLAYSGTTVVTWTYSHTVTGTGNLLNWALHDLLREVLPP
jgi:hypothetical protein